MRWVGKITVDRDFQLATVYQNLRFYTFFKSLAFNFRPARPRGLLLSLLLIFTGIFGQYSHTGQSVLPLMSGVHSHITT